MCKKHWAVRTILIVITNNKNNIELKSKCKEMPNASYANR